MIFTPRRFLSDTYEIWTGDVVMVSYLVPPHPGKETFRVIRVGLSLVAETMGFLMVYPAQREPRVERIPRSGFIGVERGLRHASPAKEVRASASLRKTPPNVLPPARG